MRFGPSTRCLGRLAGVLVAASMLAPIGGPVAAAQPAGPPALSFKRILSGYDRPVLVTHDGSPTQRLFIVEQSGRIRIARFIDGRWRKAGVFLDVSRRVLAPPLGGSEQGLLGLAFAPDYATSGRFYVDYTR